MIYICQLKLLQVTLLYQRCMLTGQMICNVTHEGEGFDWGLGSTHSENAWLRRFVESIHGHAYLPINQTNKQKTLPIIYINIFN